MREDINVAVTLQRHCDLDQSVHGITVFPGGSHYSPSVGGCRRCLKHQCLTMNCADVNSLLSAQHKWMWAVHLTPKSPAYVSSWILELWRSISLFVWCSWVQMLLSRSFLTPGAQLSSLFCLRSMRISGFIDSNRATTTTTWQPSDSLLTPRKPRTTQRKRNLTIQLHTLSHEPGRNIHSRDLGPYDLA